MPRWLRLLPLLVLVAVLATSQTAWAEPGSNFPVTVVDDTGRSLTFYEPPRRIISLSPGYTETLFALGVGEQVIAVDTWSDYPDEAKSRPRLGTWPRPNVEEIVALQPDLVVVLVEGDDFIEQMQSGGIPVLKLFPKDFYGTLETIRILGTVTGTADTAQAITEDMQHRAQAVLERTQDVLRPRVFFELDATDPSRPWAAGPLGFYGSLIEMAGGANIFADLPTSAAQVSTEQILARDPEIILLGDTTVPFNPQTPEMVMDRPGWQSITAVKNGAVLPVDANLLAKPGPRLIQGLEALARLLHPELFDGE